MMESQAVVSAEVGRAVVATYTRYSDAQQAVDYLSDQKFPVERTAIVAEGLRMVEQVTGRLTIGRVALSGALTGGVTGAVFGFVLGLLNWAAPFVSVAVLSLYGLALGAIVGSLMSMLLYSMTGGQRDFASATGFQAERYYVMVDDEFAPQAAELLRNMPARGQEA
jgi:hypothetical protein